MVSNVKYLSLKDPELFKRQPFIMLVLAIMLLIVIVAKPEIMLFLIGMAYLVFGTDRLPARAEEKEPSCGGS